MPSKPLANYPSDPYRSFGNFGVLIGEGFYVDAKEFPTGTRVKITTEILLPVTAQNADSHSPAPSNRNPNRPHEHTWAQGVDMPERIQRKRTKGWRMPPNTISVTRPGIFGNPFPVNADISAKVSVAMFRRFLRMSQTKIMDSCFDEAGESNPIGGLKMIVLRNSILKRLPELRGKNLACWCGYDQPCHADVLLKLANK